MAKSDKLYSDSPSIKRNKETGEASIQRPSEASSEDMGLSGNPLPGDDGKMPVDVEQVAQMQERHKQELQDMHKRHIKDLEATLGINKEEKKD